MKSQPICPTCNCKDVNFLGNLPDAYHFCDLQFEQPINRGALYSCDLCGLWFRFPCMSEIKLFDLYVRANENIWTEGNRSDWQLVANKVHDHCRQGKNILDVGCFRGDFLNLFFETWEKYGIELSRRAGDVARNKGIKLVGQTIGDLKGQELGFDVITMIDVFEHIPEPLSSLRRLVEHLHDDGILVIFTGVVDNPLWIKMKSKYYYAAMPEHVAFMSMRYLKFIEQELNLEVVSAEVCSHTITPRSRTEGLKTLLVSSLNLVFHPFRDTWLINKLVHSCFPIRKTLERGVLPIKAGNKDHIAAILRKSKRTM